MSFSRRRFLVSGAAALGSQGLALPSTVRADPSPLMTPERIDFAPWPFTLGVASGDPTPTAMVIWTRLAPDPLAPQGGLTGPETVWWGVATDEQFDNVVAMDSVTADPASGGAVHVDVTGLTPGTRYYYAFWALGGAPSIVGRMKTPPQGSVDHMRFALASCQAIGAGRYAAFDRMCEEDPDFILHVGDYIYEGAMGAAWPEPARAEAADLETYRARYALYRGDPQLRAAHQAVPWVLSWDDHEVVNEYWANPDPVFLTRRAAAYQAWYEHMPIRPPAGLPDPVTGFRIYRKLQFGNLMDLMVLDTRQYRDRHPCSTAVDPIGCPDPDLADPDRTMLGADQKQWLKSQLASSSAKWHCIASPLLLSDVKLGGVAAYTVPWQGCEAERTEILDHVVANDIDNVVVLSGDWHRSIVSNVKVDFTDIAAPTVASEFCGTSVTSTGDGDAGGLSTLIARLTLYPLNLNVRFYESELHGYVLCDVTGNDWLATYRVVDRNNAASPAETLAAFEVADGVPGVNMVSGVGGNPYPPGI